MVSDNFLAIGIEIVRTLIVPLTVAAAFLLLRPFLRQLTERVSRVEWGSLEASLAGPSLSGAAGTTGETLVRESGRRIAEGLREDSKEKLETLRTALESEQARQIIQYHANSLAQSRVSFWFSIGAGTLGFFVIIIGAMQLFFGSQLQTAILSVTAGTIIDAIAALFFTQSNQARKLMTEFFDKLRTDRQFNEALRLCESIPDVPTQSRIKAQLCLFFAGIPANLALAELSRQPEATTAPNALGSGSDLPHET